MDSKVAVVKAIRVSIGSQMVTLSADEASALNRELTNALAAIYAPAKPRIGRPKGAKNGTSKGKPAKRKTQAPEPATPEAMQEETYKAVKAAEAKARRAA